MDSSAHCLQHFSKNRTILPGRGLGLEEDLGLAFLPLSIAKNGIYEQFSEYKPCSICRVHLLSFLLSQAPALHTTYLTKSGLKSKEVYFSQMRKINCCAFVGVGVTPT